MRRFLIATVATLALFAGACGGGDKKNASNNDHAGNDNNGASVAASLASVCGGREAVNMGSAGASPQQSGAVNYDSAAANLRKAANAAPSEIRDDFEVVVEAQIPFFEALARANGDFSKLSSDPAFAEASEKMNADDFKTASKNIADWFTSHCS